MWNENYRSYFEVQEFELNTKNLIWQLHVTKLSVGAFELCAFDISQPAVYFASPNTMGAAYYSSSSISMVPLEGKGNEKDKF